MATTSPDTRLDGIELALGRHRHRIDLSPALDALADARILLTGASGSIGAAVLDALADHDAYPTDIATCDVRETEQVFSTVMAVEPTLILHLAGAKHAPEGEVEPWTTVETNLSGTRNVLSAAQTVGARVVAASTCKACDPETVYGASKMLAERLVMGAGQTVVRYFNVVETSGNVFRTWEALSPHAPIPVTPCSRYFITLDEAVALTLYAATMPAGRYAVDPASRPRPMPSVAAYLYPDRPQEMIPVRRGDRLQEPLHASCERVRHVNDWMWQVLSAHDAPERS